MRILAFIVLGCSLVASSVSDLEPEEIHHHTKRSIEEAEQWYDEIQRSGMMKGLQSSKRRGTKTTPESEAMDKAYTIYERALDILRTKHNVTSRAVERQVRQLTSTACPNPFPSCSSNARFRTQDGSCNNLQNPNWGMAGTAQGRLLRPAYGDGAGTPRGGFQSSLPNPRFVSTQCHPDFDIIFPGITNMIPQFGQFLDHDISITPEASRQCCAGEQDANCWPIQVPTNDYFFPSRGRRCLDFTRSTPCVNRQTNQREQMNMNTAFIDGSQVYGSGNQRVQLLRTFQGGRLIAQTTLNGFLPTATQLRQQSQGTFFAGDDRINEMPGLMVMHNVFLKEHNRIADQFRQLRPGWSDEQIFQESRRVLGAELQQITYDQYLPVLLGDNTMREYNLYLPSNGYTTYDPTQNPTITNEFSTAAYRFGHSLVQGLVQLLDVFGRSVGQYNIANEYFQDRQVTQSNGQGYDWILKGLMARNSQKFDPFVTTGMTNFLFAQQGAGFGSDLVARNIQRGRDHGLPSYNNYRSVCGLPQVGFNVSPADMNGTVWNVLRTCYNSPNDIDLFSGSLHETPVPGGLTGGTFNCLKAVQFARLKFGDRYFFTHGGQPHSFTTTQLAELRRRTLGDIICQNSQQVETQRNVFLIPSSSNPIISCTDASRSRLNLNLFVY